MTNNQSLTETQLYWDKEAANFDAEPDHGLRDPLIRAAWATLLKKWLPPAPVSILDIGCGTGSLSVLMAEQKHQVMAIDLSAAMLAHAKAKAEAADVAIEFKQMDAYAPQLAGQVFDVIVCRHLLWAMPDTAVALQRWSNLLELGGRMLLIEGFWHTGGGLHADQIMAALPDTFTTVQVENLAINPLFWGGKVDDERYMVIAER